MKRKLLATVASAAVVAGVGLGLWQARQPPHDPSTAADAPPISSLKEFKVMTHGASKRLLALAFVDDGGAERSSFFAARSFFSYLGR